MARSRRSVATTLAIVVALIATSAMSSTAAPNNVAIAVDKAVAGWMLNHGIDPAKGIGSAAVAVAYGAKIIGAYGHNGFNATKPYPVASLSKAITAVCLMQFIDGGRLKFTDTIGDVLSDRFKSNPPADPRFQAMTIEQLLIHRAGLKTNAYDDAASITTMEAAFTAIAQAPLDHDPSQTFAYSDSGYLLLGVIAQQLYKGPVAADGIDAKYKKLCGDLLTQLRTTGDLDASARDRAPSDGWVMSAIGYARFLVAFDPESKILGPASRLWLTSRREQPAYALGAYIEQQAGGGFTLSHTGLLHHSATHPDKGGSLFFRNAVGYSAVVIFSGENLYPDSKDPVTLKAELANQTLAYDDLMAAIKSALTAPEAQQPPPNPLGLRGTSGGGAGLGAR
jgi:beta-lactamase family protein